MQPSRQPYYRPSSAPSAQPNGQPSLFPSLQPNCYPSFIPSLQPTGIPTSTPTTFLESILLLKNATRLIHKFSFNNAASTPSDSSSSSRRRLTEEEAISSQDPIGNFTAYLSPEVSLSNGKVTFDYYNFHRLSYISLPSYSIGAGKIVSLEFWVDFKSTNDVTATLFAFGDTSLGTNFTARAEFEKQGVMYLAYVYNPLEGYTKMYINGGLSRVSRIPQQPLYQRDSSTHYAYIGRNVDGSGPGMTCTIDEVRIFEGELSAAAVNNHFIVGVDPSHVSISSKVTLNNVNLTFLAISKQSVEVSFLGGASKIPMFGPDTLFDIASSDSLCEYKITVPLSAATSSATTKLAAMNYTVSLSPLSRAVPAPQLDPTRCDYTNPTTQCYCAPSKSLYSYLSDCNALTQPVVVTEVNQSVPTILFTYRSGVCMEVVGSESFSVTPGRSNVKKDHSCFLNVTSFVSIGDSSPATVSFPAKLDEGQSQSLKVVLFERYPERYRSSSHRIDFNVESSEISVSDPASGFNSIQTFEYNATLVRSPLSPSNATGSPVAVKYVMHISNPYPVFPFAFPLTILGTRNGRDGPSVVSMTWFIPVVGVIANEIPNFIPVASDPTLIFFILRDPPGGGSSASLEAGTSIDFGMSIENMHSYDGSFSFDWSVTGGVSGASKTMIGLGAGVVTPMFSAHATVGGGGGKSQSVSTSRSSSTSYQYSVSFDYSFSTSTDPFTAGHASDIIVGGGVDLIVSKAIAGMSEILVLLVDH